MKWLAALYVLVPLICWAQLEVPERVEFTEQEVCVTVFTPDHVQIVFDPETILLIDPEHWDQPAETIERGPDAADGRWTMHVWGPPQRYLVRQIDPKTLSTQTKIFALVKGDSPHPPDPPPPGPDPPPPPPVVNLPKGCVIVFETASGGIANHGANPAVQRALTNVFPGKWRVYDPDISEDTLIYEDPEMVSLFRYAREKGSVPWVVISTGSAVTSQALPDTVAEFMALLGVSASTPERECTFDIYGNRYCRPK